MERKKPQEWTNKEVTEWLDSLDLSRYKEAFEAFRIDGMLLFEMTEEDLANDIGVPVRLHRFKILENIKKLKEEPQGLESQESEESSKDQQSEEKKWEVLSLKAVEGQLLNNTFLIGTSGATIGRNSGSNDIIISESFVSRKHCEVKYNERTNQFLLFDTGSTTGTFLMVKQSLELELGMMFQMGLSEFKVVNVKYDPYGKAKSIELLAYEGPARQSTIKVGRDGLTIGRDRNNSYSIREDSQMSSYHSKIQYEEGKFKLMDVGSTNKTWMRLSGEGEPSKEFPLLVGDVMKIGSTVLVAELPEDSESVAKQVDPENSAPEDIACKICFTRESNVAYYPCGHMLCEFCAKKCSNCPICRKPVQDVIKLYR